MYCRYVPNDSRGGMISFSLAPANAAVLLFLVQVSFKYDLLSSLSPYVFPAVVR